MGYGLIVWLIAVTWAVFFVVPPAEGLGDYVRLAFFHIPAAWVSVLAFVLAAWWAAQYLRTRKQNYDRYSAVSASIGLGFCFMATVSGAIFSKLTWGAYWNWDPRQTTIFILLLIYGAYLALRNAIEEPDQRAKIAAVYALLSTLTVPFLVFIIPRYYASLHPEPILNSAGKIYMDNIMLYVLIGAVIGFTWLFWLLLKTGVKRMAKDADYQTIRELAKG